MAAGALRETLGRHTVPGVLWRRRADDRLECTACAHRCGLGAGATGLCGVRTRDGDTVRVPFGYVAARRIRPVETNTIYHVMPGARALIFGMYGCDLRCPYCHNWTISQALRDDVPEATPLPTTPTSLVGEAIDAGCGVIAAAYNEPMIAAEWVHAVFGAARARQRLTAVVSDGNTTPEALTFLRPVTDVYRVDLKGFTDRQYATLGGRLDTVLAAIATARALGYWVEVVTLVVPGFNDDLQGLRWLAREIAAVDPDIPWHLNAFHPRYRWRDRPVQGAGLLVSAAGAAYGRGLRYVYVGNLADRALELSHTRCPRCDRVVVERHDYRTRAVALVGGQCPDCATDVPGLWTRASLARAA